MIYLLCMEDAGRVKIGFTQNLESRMNAFKTYIPMFDVFVAICDGDEREERLMHSRFAEHLIAGEWFHYRGSLYQFIQSLSARDGTCHCVWIPEWSKLYQESRQESEVGLYAHT